MENIGHVSAISPSIRRFLVKSMGKWTGIGSKSEKKTDFFRLFSTPLKNKQQKNNKKNNKK